MTTSDKTPEPRDLDELLKLPYSDMTNDEIDCIINWKSEQAYSAGYFQGQSDTLKELSAKKSAEHRRMAIEYMLKIGGDER